MSDTIKIMVYVSTNKVGSKCEDEIEIDRAEWESMSIEEQEELCRDTAFNYLDWGYEVIE